MARKQKVLDFRLVTGRARYPGEPTNSTLYMTIRNRRNTLTYSPYITLEPCGFTNLVNMAIRAADAVSFIRF